MVYMLSDVTHKLLSLRFPFFLIKIITAFAELHIGGHTYTRRSQTRKPILGTIEITSLRGYEILRLLVFFIYFLLFSFNRSLQLS